MAQTKTSDLAKLSKKSDEILDELFSAIKVICLVSLVIISVQCYGSVLILWILIRDGGKSDFRLHRKQASGYPVWRTPDSQPYTYPTNFSVLFTCKAAVKC